MRARIENRQALFSNFGEEEPRAAATTTTTTAIRKQPLVRL